MEDIEPDSSGYAGVSPCAFKLLSDQKSFIAYASAEEDTRVWLTALNEAIINARAGACGASVFFTRRWFVVCCSRSLLVWLPPSDGDPLVGSPSRRCSGVDARP